MTHECSKCGNQFDGDNYSRWCNDCYRKHLDELVKEEEIKERAEKKRIEDCKNHAHNHANKTAMYQIHLMEQILESLIDIKYNIQKKRI